MKQTILYAIWKFGYSLVSWVNYHDKEYIRYYSHRMSYREYVVATREWRDLVKRYGSWEAVARNEPDKANELESRLA